MLFQPRPKNLRLRVTFSHYNNDPRFILLFSLTGEVQYRVEEVNVETKNDLPEICSYWPTLLAV